MRVVILGISLHNAYGFVNIATTNPDLEKYTSALALITYVLREAKKNGINYTRSPSASTLNVTKEGKR